MLIARIQHPFCPFTCFAQEQLLASSCCQFPTRRLKGEALSREVMLQSRTGKNKWIQWGNIKFIGQMSSRQLVLIYCCSFQLVNNTVSVTDTELKGMERRGNGWKNRIPLCRALDCNDFRGCMSEPQPLFLLTPSARTVLCGCHCTSWFIIHC